MRVANTRGIFGCFFGESANRLSRTAGGKSEVGGLPMMSLIPPRTTARPPASSPGGSRRRCGGEHAKNRRLFLGESANRFNRTAAGKPEVGGLLIISTLDCPSRISGAIPVPVFPEVGDRAVAALGEPSLGESANRLSRTASRGKSEVGGIVDNKSYSPTHHGPASLPRWRSRCSGLPLTRRRQATSRETRRPPRRRHENVRGTGSTTRLRRCCNNDICS